MVNGLHPGINGQWPPSFFSWLTNWSADINNQGFRNTFSSLSRVNESEIWHEVVQQVSQNKIDSMEKCKIYLNLVTKNERHASRRLDI